MSSNVKLWSKNYPKNVSLDLGEIKEKSLCDVMENSCKKYSERVAFSSMGKELSFNDLLKTSYKLAEFLQRDWNLKKGDCVAIMMPNILPYPIAVFSSFLTGLVITNINPLSPPLELAFQLKDSKAKAIIALNFFGKTIQEAIEINGKDSPLKHVMLSKIGDLFPTIKGLVMNFVVKNIQKKVPAYDFNHNTFSEILNKKGEFDKIEIEQEDLAFLQYTGGTTGNPKAAMLSHKNLLSNLYQVDSFVTHTEKDVIVTALPIYHIFSLNANLLRGISLGSKQILIANPRDVKSVVKDLKNEKFTCLCGVNTLFNLFMNDEDFCKLDFSNLIYTIGGGMAVLKDTADRWHKLTGRIIYQGYGLTETSPAVTLSNPDLTSFDGSTGIPVPSTDILIIDDSGQEVETGKEGEVCVKGPQVMKSYWNNEEETKQAFHKGEWFKTGDIGKLDENGCLYLTDRKKDMIIVSGFNVYPTQVEDVISQHPSVFEVACIGVPSERSNEEVKAFVILEENQHLTLDELRKFCKDRMLAYKVPSQLEIVDSLPKSNVGKILRRLLRK
ncbi:AMP-binding protein [Ichthyobacterium seriolicida]|uniref:Long-chain-fatty-acid--CoA ligase n=1 Tax=Ichthyobacterium seriolicida TaxID=242600 RepID=A0A1J1EAG7_9FLAO|nr:AMP-binding protein [Ichthyobacterium seriolicida]BAV94931.1 long-chain-fatty-acid--CoA ligase [Ichthyobacterium seriolicida]